MALSSLSKLIIIIDENNIDIRLVASLNEYQQSIFLAKVRKIMYTPVNPSLLCKKCG